MKIGVFGGCFNPPHIIHKQICLDLLKQKILDKIIIVPTGNSYQKNDLIDAKHRLKLLSLVFNNIEGIEISDYEIKDEQIFTYQTLGYFSQKYSNDEIFLIIGADNLKEIETWKNYKNEIVKYTIIVIGRNNENLILLKNKLPNLKLIIGNFKESSISSSTIRESIKNGKDTKILFKVLDKEVLQYILQNKLYL